jgi:hypothetical protein
MITLLNALEPYFNYRTLWVAFDQALGEFHRIDTNLQYCVVGVPADQIDVKELEVFRSEHEATWDRLSRVWADSRRAGSVEVGREEAAPARSGPKSEK